MTAKEAKQYLAILPDDTEVELHIIENKTISSGEVEKLGISRQLLRYHVSTGQVRTVPHGKQKRYLLEDILRIKD